MAASATSTRRECNTGFFMHLLSFDHFTSGKPANGLSRAGHTANPFNVDIVG